MLPNPNRENVTQALKHYEALFAAQDVDAILEGFAPDVVVRYGSNPPFVGKDRLAQLLKARFSAMRDYRLAKKLELVADNRYASSWTGSWIDVSSGQRMELFGVEVLTLREGLFVEWTAAVSTWPSSAL